MKIVNVCWDDYANFSFDNSMALRSVGLDATSVKSVKHPFGYSDQSLICNEDEIRRHIAASDIVQLMHSDKRFLQYAKMLKKRIVVYHTGTAYRVNPDVMNDIFNPHVWAAFTDQTEFIGTGMKNEQYVAGAINVRDYKQFGHEVRTPFVIAHYPSNPGVKGTDQILEMARKLKGDFKFEYSLDKVKHEDQIKRMDLCDIYIELFKSVLNGKPYGCYGVTAFEAAAAGKVVVTQNIRPHVYAKAYGECPFIIANDEETFISEVQKLINYKPLIISSIQTETYNWVIEKHSYEATGQRLKKLLAIS